MKNRTLELLRRYESRNVTYIARDGSWPIVWERARGVHVWDDKGRRYLDLTAAFGVAAAGHSNPAVAKAGQRQMKQLLHAMGDVHPHRLKAELARELSRITYERWSGKELTAKTIFCNSGFEAVEAALKTAALVCGVGRASRPGVIAFTAGYHGLGYGTLNVTHRDDFRVPFQSQLKEFGHFVEFPSSSQPGVDQLRRVEADIRRLCDRGDIGAVLAEPVQGRGGIRIPPKGFLTLLRKLCDELNLLLVCDEIFTGFGRCGKWFACEHEKVIPDLICLGKALTGGFPLSVCVGRADVMDQSWPESTGEAIHTSTFLGHPVGCAMALAQIGEISRLKLVPRSEQLGAKLREMLGAIAYPAGLRAEVRGLGLMTGIEFSRDGKPATRETVKVMKRMLQKGFIMLPEGKDSNVISFTPPLTVSEQQLRSCSKALERVLRDDIS